MRFFNKQHYMLAKKGLLWIMLIAVFGLLFAFVPPKKKSNPPGTVHFRDNLFMDAEPISNNSYLEFLFYCSRYDMDCAIEYNNSVAEWQSLENYKSYLVEHCGREGIDSSLVPKSLLAAGCIYNDGDYIDGDMYFRHPAFNQYPVIGITHQQAIALCRWRTSVARTVMYGIYGKKPLNGYFNFEYRLPHHYELQGFVEQFKMNDKFSKRAPDLSPENYWCPEYADSKKYKEAAFSNIYEFTQSEDSLFYVMESDTGLTFFNQGDEVRVGKRHTGFRCVCEIKE